MDMCRACLATGLDMVLMNEVFVNKYNIFTNLDIKLSEDVPLYTCQTCFEAVNFCMEFREKCISSDKALSEVSLPRDITVSETNSHSKIDQDDVITDIKNEIKYEYDSDSILLEDHFDDISNQNLIKSEDEQEELKPKKGIRKSKRIHSGINKNLSNKEHNAKIITEKREKLLDDIETMKYCGICTKKYENLELLMKHLEQHKRDNCGLCIEQFLDFTHLLAHRIEHVPDEQKRCHICSKKFITSPSLEFHYMKKHGFRGEDGQLLCKICLSPYSSSRNLSKHMAAVHCDLKYICNECGKGFRQKSQLRIHLLIHAGEKMCKCDLCDFTCKQRNGMRAHKLRKHTDGKVVCKTCGRAFQSQSHLDKHSCKHHLGVVCPICGVTVSKSTLLKRHLSTHEGGHRYKCERCPAKFKCRGAYNSHVNKHDNNRAFRCEYCPMGFFSQTVLIKHRRTHTGEKPYVCKVCGKAFTGNNNLKVHMKVHGQHLIIKRNNNTSDIVTS